MIKLVDFSLLKQVSIYGFFFPCIFFRDFSVSFFKRFSKDIKIKNNFFYFYRFLSQKRFINLRKK